MTTQTTPAPARDDSPPFWEWVCAGLGLVLLLGSIAFLLWDGFAHADSPPSPRLEVVAVQQQPGQWLVRVRAHNDGTRPASALRVSGELRQGREVIEQAQTEFQHVPGRSSREAGLFFQADPRRHALQLQVRSFQQP